MDLQFNRTSQNGTNYYNIEIDFDENTTDSSTTVIINRISQEQANSTKLFKKIFQSNTTAPSNSSKKIPTAKIVDSTAKIPKTSVSTPKLILKSSNPAYLKKANVHASSEDYMNCIKSTLRSSSNSQTQNLRLSIPFTDVHSADSARLTKQSCQELFSNWKVNLKLSL